LVSSDWLPRCAYRQSFGRPLPLMPRSKMALATDALAAGEASPSACVWTTL
jgi:hypothetical protein